MDYNVLTASSSTNGSIANWANHAAVQNASQTILEEAQSFIYRRLRHWKMLTSTTGSIVLNNDYIGLPSDFLEDKVLMITGVNATKLTRKTIQEVTGSYIYDGNGNRVSSIPNIYSHGSTNIQLDTPADQTYPYLLWYFQQLAPLSSSNTTNFLTSTYPRLVRCACMIGAAEFMKDAGLGNYDRTYWEQQANDEIDMANIESDKSQRSVEIGMQLI